MLWTIVLVLVVLWLLGLVANKCLTKQAKIYTRGARLECMKIL